MKKQTIIITGASSGIGFGIAKYFLERGDNVVINSSDISKLNKAFEELGASENIALVAGNVSDKNTGIKLVEKAIEKFGSADVLVNNAGISMRALFKDTDIQVLKSLMDVNFWGMVYLSLIHI